MSSKMDPADHRYDNIIDFFRRFPRLANVRTFRELNLTRILQLQAKIDAYQRMFESGTTEVSDGAANAINLSTMVDQFSESGTGLDSTPDIWQILREYDELLWRNIQILSLQPPLPRDLELLQDKIGEIDGVAAHDTSPWHANDDFVALFTNSNERFDRFTSWVFEKLPFFHKYIYLFRTHDTTFAGGEVYPYNKQAFASIVTMISVLAAVSINVSSIYILYFIESMKIRLGVIMIYTPLFALLMMLLTNSGVASIFPATATYAAVLVVFIGNNNNNGN